MPSAGDGFGPPHIDETCASCTSPNQCTNSRTMRQSVCHSPATAGARSGISKVQVSPGATDTPSGRRTLVSRW
jgi:hypothetical protein